MQKQFATAAMMKGIVEEIETQNIQLTQFGFCNISPEQDRSY